MAVTGPFPFRDRPRQIPESESWLTSVGPSGTPSARRDDACGRGAGVFLGAGTARPTRARARTPRRCCGDRTNEPRVRPPAGRARRRDRVPFPGGGPAPRMTRLDLLRSALAARPGQPVGFDELIAAVWAGDRPAHPKAALRNLVQRLRATDAVVTEPHGYRLVVRPPGPRQLPADLPDFV